MFKKVTRGTNETFFDLVKELDKVSGIERIRISSIEPNLLKDEIIEFVAKSRKIVHHFHIPLQSGCNAVLAKMQRRYNRELFKSRIDKIKSLMPDAFIGVDVIVGFPGETEDDFIDTYNFIKELPVSYLHVFTYSERPNTKAIEMPGKVEIVERKRRNNMLRILSEKKKNEFYRKMIGKQLNVLFEHDKKDGMMRGFASNYVRVKQIYDESLINNFSKVNILDVENNECITEVSINKFKTKSIAG